MPFLSGGNQNELSGHCLVGASTMWAGASASMSSMPELFEDVSMDEFPCQLKKPARSLENGNFSSMAVSTVATLADLPKYSDEEGEKKGKLLSWARDPEYVASASSSLDVLGDFDVLWEDEDLGEIMGRQYSPDEPDGHTEMTLEFWGIHAMHNFGYELLNFLAEGRASFVRRAKTCSSGHIIAVKSAGSRGHSAQAKLRGEFNILRNLRHNGIVKADALFESRFDIWMCMELCHAGSLQSHVCAQGHLCEARSRPLFEQLLEAVDYIHDLEIVHNALSPKHVLLTDNASVLKICDFGHAEKVGCRIMPADARAQRHRPNALDEYHELLSLATWKKRLDLRACGAILRFMLQGKVNENVEQGGCGRGGDIVAFDINGGRGFTEPKLVKLSVIAHYCLAIGVARRLTARGLLTTFFS